MSFRMKKKPKKPIRITYERKWSIHGFDDKKLSDIIAAVKKEGLTPEKLTLKIHHYYEDYEAYFSWNEIEDDDSFNLRMDGYKQKLKEYKEWEKENAHLIKHELDRREKQKRYELKQQWERTEKELRKLERERDKMKKELENG